MISKFAVKLYCATGMHIVILDSHKNEYKQVLYGWLVFLVLLVVRLWLDDSFSAATILTRNLGRMQRRNLKRATLSGRV